MSYSLSNYIGLIGATLSFLFLIIFITLGFYQKDYSHKKHTVSLLVHGKHGWIQTINFVLLATAFLLIGFGVGNSTYKNIFNPISISSILFSLGIIVTMLFPTDKASHDTSSFIKRSRSGKVHFISTYSMIILAPILIYLTLKAMALSSQLVFLIPYTVFVLISNSVLSALWIFLNKKKFVSGWRGLFQKTIITNAIVWLIIVGLKL